MFRFDYILSIVAESGSESELGFWTMDIMGIYNKNI